MAADPTPPTVATLAAALPERVAALAGRLDPSTAAYLDRVRAVVADLVARDPAAGDVRGALAEVAARAAIDTDVPTASRQPALRYVKGGVKAVSSWYLRYVAHQVTAFAGSVATLGEALAARADALEATAGVLAERLTAVEERLERLEQRQQRGDQ